MRLDAGQGVQFNVIIQEVLQLISDSGHVMATSTVGSWISANSNMSTNQVNFFDSTSATFYLTGVQLETGSNSTDFEHKSYTEQLRECYRYYWELSAARYSTNTFLPFQVWMESTGACKSSVMFPVDMRDAPTIAETLELGMSMVEQVETQI